SASKADPVGTGLWLPAPGTSARFPAGRWPLSSGQFLAGREAQGHLVPRPHRKMDSRLPLAPRPGRRGVRGHWRLLRKAEEYTLPVDGVREEEPFRHDRLMRNALGAVVHGGLDNVEVPQPDGLLLIRTRGVEIPNDDLVLAELVVESPVA